MCSRAAARSVAAMRPLPPPLTAAAGATAAVLAVTPSAHAADAVYGGTPRQATRSSSRADAKATELRSIAISWRATCAGPATGFPGGGVLTPAEPVAGFAPSADELLVSKNAKGGFAGTQLALTAAAGADRRRHQGQAQAGKATGTLSATVKIVDQATGAHDHLLPDRPKRWTATRDPGIIYGGATSQGQPFVVRLNQQRKRVNDVITTWYAPCTPRGRTSACPITSATSPSRAPGGSATRSSGTTTLDAGGKRHCDYSSRAG